MLDTSSVYDSEFDNSPQAQAAQADLRDPSQIWMDPVDGFSVNLADQGQPKRGLTIEQMLAADPDILREARKKDPEAFQSHVDQVTEAVARDFRATNKEYIPTERNQNALVQYLCRTRLNADWLSGDDALNELHDVGLWTVGALTQAYKELLKAGALDVPAGTVRNLTSEELLSVRATLKLEGAEQAVGSYIRFALNGKIPRSQHDLLTCQPDLVKKATASVWAWANNVSPQDLLALRRGGHLRTITYPTFKDLDEAWNAFKVGREQAASQQPVAEVDPRSLSDEDLEKYRLASIEELRKARRRPSF